MNRTIRLCALAGRDGIAAPVPRAAVFVPPTSYQKGTVTDPPLHGQTGNIADPKRPETSRPRGDGNLLSKFLSKFAFRLTPTSR